MDPLNPFGKALPFPSGANETDTLINGAHYNLTLLKFFNYTLYANKTLSNVSDCYLVFDIWKPIILFDNGTWVNSTNCYVPILHIKTRGYTGIVFAALWAISIMFTLVNLKKHGQEFLREDKRFRLVGRRWQWYWMCFVATCGIISCVTSVDVDRDYLQDLSIILQSFFYFMMVPGILATVWEATRHWGSWQERQIYDRDPFSLPQDDKRGQVEFWLPLFFYLFAWLNFFMIVPRSWTPIEQQHDFNQQETIARPSATDIRHKAGAILAAVAMAVICYSLSHSLYHYKKPPTTGILRRIDSFCRNCPAKLLIPLIVLGLRIGYGIASAWLWEINIMKFDSNPGWFYGLGYGPTLLIIIIFNVAGFVEPNEDKALIAQRIARGREIDAEIGIVHKPAWWNKMHGVHLTADDQLKNLASELPGGKQVTANVELGDMGGAVRNRSRGRPVDDPFRDHGSGSESGSDGRGFMRPGMGRGSDAGSMMTGVSGHTGTSGRTLTETERPMKVRSMLDV